MKRRTIDSAAALTAALAVLLASTALSRSYTDLSFLPPVVSAIVVAFALGWIGRRLEVPAGLAPAVSFVGFIEYLTIAYFRKDAFLGVIPVPQVFRAAGRVIHEGARDINQLAAPVVPTRELIFITVAGVFAVAVVVDLIALRLRRPVLAGLPLLILFVIPSSLSPTGAGWLSFALAAVGYLALLTTEGRDRVHRWGRRLATTRHAVDDGYRKPVARAARGIGAAAIGFALVLPGLTPGLQNGLLTGTGAATGSGGFGRGGGSGRTTISPVADLRRNLNQSTERELIRMWTTDPQYLRMAILEDFTRQAWRVSKRANPRLDASRPIAAPPGLADSVARRNVTARISISKQLDGSYLPVPYAPSRLAGIEKRVWRYDEANRAIESSSKSIRGSSFTVESVIVTPDPEAIDDDLPYPADITPYTKLQTAQVDQSVIKLARSITAKETTNWGRAVALQNFFTSKGGFTYSTSVQSGSGGDALKTFLADKVGYCEQFAAAMAVMVRAIGMPSRVVVGFTSGTLKGDYYSITNKNAHAWPEIYFPSVGWVRFEPTPGGAAGAGPAVTTPAVTAIVPTKAASAAPTASAEVSSGPRAAISGQRPDFADRNPRGGPTSGDFSSRSHTSRRPLLVALLGLLALLIPVAPAATRSAMRRRSRRGADTTRRRSHVAWRHVYDDAYDLQLGWPAAASPRVAARSLVAAGHLDGAAASALSRLAVAEEYARYAPASYAAPSTPDFDSDVAIVRAALLAAVSTKRRLRAMIFPSSTLRVISKAVHLRSAVAGALTGRLASRLPLRLRMRPS